MGVVLGKLASCSDGGVVDGMNDPVPVRISPVRVERADAPGDASAWALFDRDTRAGWSPPSAPPGRSTRVRVALGRTTRITHLKIFGTSPYVLNAFLFDISMDASGGSSGGGLLQTLFSDVGDPTLY